MIGRLNHVAIAVKNLDAACALYRDTLGLAGGREVPAYTGGANVLVFTTGRGSVLGLKPTPCIKVATNTPMYERMLEDMDLVYLIMFIYIAAASILPIIHPTH